jgi:hypothetical protein
VVKNLACGSLYFWSYTPWKIGFVASPETSVKHVFREIKKKKKKKKKKKRHNLFITDPNSVKQNVLVRV